MTRKAVNPKGSSRGFTLAEMLIATAVLALISAAIFTLLFQSQDAYQSQEEIVEVTQQARIAMDQIVRYIRQAGNDPEDILDSQTAPGGHGHSGLYPIEILTVGPDYQIQINSDITGAVPDASSDPLKATGDPDGTLDNLYEKVTVRYDSNTDTLYINIGYGEEILAENIPGFALIFYDKDGNITVNEANIVRVRVSLQATTVGSARTQVQSITLESDVFLRSKAFDLFAT